MADGNLRTYQGRAAAAQDLLVDGLPPCSITVTADGTGHVVAQLADEDTAALRSAAPTHDDLCQRAQHALGLAGIGSRIDADRMAIGVYAGSLPTPSGVPPVVLDGSALLWAIARTPSESIRALIAAAIDVMRAARDA